MLGNTALSGLMLITISMVLVTIILYISIRYKDDLISDKGKARIRDHRNRYYGIIFFAIAAASLFVALEFFEVKEALLRIYGLNTSLDQHTLEEHIILVQQAFTILTQALLLSLLYEVRRK